MNPLISVVGASGVGKTAFVNALAATGQFTTALEQHAERPFQLLFKHDKKFALANQIDYLLLRAEQEKRLRAANKPGLVDGGLDLDLHGFTRLFHRRGLISDAEYDLCARLHSFFRQTLPPPDLIVALSASQKIIETRLASRSRINIASAQDAELLNQFIHQWLDSVPPAKILRIDTSNESKLYPKAIQRLLAWVAALRSHPADR